MTRDLLKVNNGANPAAYKELLHVIKYVLDMKNLGIKLNPQGIPMIPEKSFVFATVIMQEARWVDEA